MKCKLCDKAATYIYRGKSLCVTHYKSQSAKDQPAPVAPYRKAASLL